MTATAFEIDLTTRPLPVRPLTAGTYYGQAGKLMYVPQLGRVARVLAQW